MSICSECEFYDPVDETKGKCKVREIERHVAQIDGVHKEVINGWPVTSANEPACGEFA